METIEYHGVIDKSRWARGPWDNEPDKVQWRDEETGMACLIVRGRHGSLCGYVGVEPGHPWHSEFYDDIGNFTPKPDGYDETWYLDVHGGLTFSGGCGHGDDPAKGICHIPGDGETDDVWWLGFDCAHCDDLMPSDESFFRETSDIYRDVPYVRAEVLKLAQAARKTPSTNRDDRGEG